MLDCELLPWSAKALELIQRQYAAVGAAGRAGLTASIATLERGAARGLDLTGWIESSKRRLEHVDHYIDAYRRYVWPVDDVADLRLAPFHVLAAESGVFVDRGHDWHIDCCDRLVAANPGWFKRTDRRVVDLADADSQAAAAVWWEELTAAGGEGVVVKPMSFVARGPQGSPPAGN